MSGYARTTRECPIDQVQPGLYKIVQEYFQKHQLGDPIAETRLCCETVSEKKEPAGLGVLLAPLLYEGSDTTIHLAMLLTADWLIWARSGDRSEIIVTGARLKFIQVKAFVSRRTKYMELEVTGYINDTKESVRGNLQLGPDLAAQKFCDEVGQAVKKAHPPTKRRFFGLLGG
jgi:hypothetical protein